MRIEKIYYDSGTFKKTTVLCNADEITTHTSLTEFPEYGEKLRTRLSRRANREVVPLNVDSEVKVVSHTIIEEEGNLFEYFTVENGYGYYVLGIDEYIKGKEDYNAFARRTGKI